MKYIAVILVLTGSVLAQSARLTNQTVRAMIRGGVPVPLIVQAIRAADQYTLESSDGELNQLIAAGATTPDAQEIMRAIEQHANSGQQVHVISAVRTVTMPLLASVSPVPVSGSSKPYTVQRLMLADGTPVRLRLATNLSSGEEFVGDSVPFEVLDEVLVDGARAALRGDKSVKGGSHVGAVTTAVVLTSAAVSLPVGSLWLLKHGEDAALPKGTEVRAVIDGDTPLEVMSN